MNRRKLRTTFVSLLLVADVAICGAVAFARTPPGSTERESVPAMRAPAQACGALAQLDLEGLKGAPAIINSTTPVAATASVPAHCEVRGYVRPQVGFVLDLPDRWNGKFLMTGCGGYCGVLLTQVPWFDDGLKRGYAVATTDMGHSSTPLDAKWAYGNLQAKIDFAYRGTHVTALAAKAIIAAHYGSKQRLSYFAGCSTGGRQALMSAQRYPDDFEGIIAGAPAAYYTTSSFAIVNSGLSNIRADGSQILGPADATLIHDTVVKKCDALDGLRDGMIGNPYQCRFSPAELQCKTGQSKNCLSAEKIAAAQKIYEGPKDSRGHQIHVGTYPFGSELTWLNRIIGPDGKPGYNVSWMIDRYRYMAYTLDPGPSWQIKDLDFANDPNRAGGLGEIYSADNPDLRKFKARGGKLIHYQGWQDPSVVPGQSLNYYNAVVRAMGGLDQTQAFYRLFMIPGMGHCAGGQAADTVDYLSYLENWVEHGQAPDSMIGAHVENGKTTFTRPHFPYPAYARYKGAGDATLAASFQRVAGSLQPTGAPQ